MVRRPQLWALRQNEQGRGVLFLSRTSGAGALERFFAKGLSLPRAL